MNTNNVDIPGNVVIAIINHPFFMVYTTHPNGDDCGMVCSQSQILCIFLGLSTWLAHLPRHCRNSSCPLFVLVLDIKQYIYIYINT